ncbi:MAG: hypothetical protein AAF713_17735 [Pseudomonadota bacterium]
MSKKAADSAMAAWSGPAKDAFEFWVSFFPTAPLFGVEWRFANMVPVPFGIEVGSAVAKNGSGTGEPSADVVALRRVGGMPAKRAPAKPAASKPATPKPPKAKTAPKPVAKAEVKVETPAKKASPSKPAPVAKAEAPKPAAKVEAPKPTAKVEAPKPTAKVEVPKPAAKVETPKPAAVEPAVSKSVMAVAPAAKPTAKPVEKPKTAELPLTVAPAAAPSKEPPGLLHIAPKDPDDLKLIKGIGPGLEKQLNGLGIYKFTQIAAFSEGDLAWVDENLTAFKGRCFRDDWIGQARNKLN